MKKLLIFSLLALLVIVIGPVLLGMAKPVHLLQRGATVEDITNLAAISVVDAEQRKHQTGGTGEI